MRRLMLLILFLAQFVARPMSTFAPDKPRMNRRGCPKIRYLIVRRDARPCIDVASLSLVSSSTLYITHKEKCLRFHKGVFSCVPLL